MSVLIKEVDKELYAKFKSKAALKGLRINEAFTEAIIQWLAEGAIKDTKNLMRQQNNATFRRIFPDLVKDHEGKWVVISEGLMIGIFGDRKAAIKAVIENKLEDKCNIVSPISNKKRTTRLGLRRI
jgi:hypothetical protein